MDTVFYIFQYEHSFNVKLHQLVKLHTPRPVGVSKDKVTECTFNSKLKITFENVSIGSQCSVVKKCLHALSKFYLSWNKAVIFINCHVIT